jgi:hypothetical protein
MHLTTFLSAAAAVATVSARNAVDLTKSCDFSKPHIRIINRCEYKVNLWSVLKTDGCPEDGMVTLKKGEVYSENLITATETPSKDCGISIKISKTEKCKGNDIAQAEYFLDDRQSTGEAFRYNYYDMSYVDCASDCPTKQEGFYWQAGTSQLRAAKATMDDSWCPILSCHDSDSCAKISYILPDDVQTKTCTLQASHDLYLCGSEAPSDDDEKPAPSAPASSPKQPEPKPSSIVKPVVSSAAIYKANIAAVTNAPEIKDEIKAPVKVKTEIVYVTAIEYVNAKRHDHAHAHARRHQQFHA